MTEPEYVAESTADVNLGGGTIRFAVVLTAVFTVTQIAADIHPDGPVLAVATFVSLAMFFGGTLAFVAAFLIAVGRSRDEQVTLAGILWLSNIAPTDVARTLRLVVVVQLVVAVATAGVRPFTALAFGILAPMAGLAAIAWWAARHGSFRSITGLGAKRRHPDDRPVGAGPPRRSGSMMTLRDDTGEDVREISAATQDEDPDDFDQLFRRRRKGRGKSEK